MSSIKFETSTQRSFHSDLLKNVNAYFKENNISKHANATMVSKTIILLSAYFIPYFLILFLGLPAWTNLILCVVMGTALAGIGMGVMHDSCHGSYSTKPWLNTILSYSMNLIGGNRYNWMIQHNVKHHTYTNIFHADEDLDNGNVIRLSPYSEHKSFHRYQHIYSWFLYSLGTLSWVTVKDFKQFKSVYDHDTKNHSKRKFAIELSTMIFTKILYYTYMIVIPYLVLDVAFWQVLVGFLTLHLVAGWILSVTFQLAHIVENTEHTIANVPEPTEIKDSWAIHQIKTTANFARKSKFLNWYLGGLNFQVEHHLFPNICHVHYSAIAPIVKETVEAHGYKYIEFETMPEAIRSHYNTLKEYSTTVLNKPENNNPVLENSLA